MWKVAVSESVGTAYGALGSEGSVVVPAELAIERGH